MVKSSVPSPFPLSHRIQQQIQALSLESLRSLQSWLADLIAQREAEATLSALSPTAGRTLVEQRRVGRVTYQLEKVRCGKAGCRCAPEDGELHGPYWYLYRWNGKKVVSEYVGKRLPPDVSQSLAISLVNRTSNASRQEPSPSRSTN